MTRPDPAKSDARSFPELPRSVAAIAAQHLEREIIEGRLAPGERLIEEQWAERFGISRGSFREVLRILESARLLEIVPRRGARVAYLNRRDIEEIYILRKHLLKLAYFYAATNMTEAHLESLHTILEDMKRVVERGDVIEFCALSQRFDALVVDVAGIVRLRLVVEFLGKQAIRYRYIGFKVPGQIQQSLDAHRKILEAFEKRDGESAGANVYEAIERAGERILSNGPWQALEETGVAFDQAQRVTRPLPARQAATRLA